MTKTIAVVNQKGGVGKTTTVANIGYVLAKEGKKVLLIDFDSQASLTRYLGVGFNGPYRSIYEILIKELRGISEDEDKELSSMSLEEMIEISITRPTYMEAVTKTIDGKRQSDVEFKEFGMDLLPSKLELSDYELELSSGDYNGNGFHLSHIIDIIKERYDYDYIIIDCNPSIGVLTMNAVIAATEGLLIPTNLDQMSVWGVSNLLDRVVSVQDAIMQRGSCHYGVIGIILNLYSEFRTVDRTVKDDINRFYPFKMFKSHIPDSINAKKAVMSGVTYSQMHKKAEAAYTELVKEIEEQIKEMEKNGPQVIRMNHTEMSQLHESTPIGDESEEN